MRTRLTDIFYQLAEQVSKNYYIQTGTSVPIKVELPKFIFEIMVGETYNANWFPIPSSLDSLQLKTPTDIEFTISKIKEVPKKRKVKMAPALIKHSKYAVSGELFPNEDAARHAFKVGFVKWLIDTPYEVTVEEEVSDNET